MFSFPFLQRPINGSDTSDAPVFKGSIRTLDGKSQLELRFRNNPYIIRVIRLH